MCDINIDAAVRPGRTRTHTHAYTRARMGAGFSLCACPRDLAVETFIISAYSPLVRVFCVVVIVLIRRLEDYTMCWSCFDRVEKQARLLGGWVGGYFTCMA